MKHSTLISLRLLSCVFLQLYPHEISKTGRFNVRTSFSLYSLPHKNYDLKVMCAGVPEPGDIARLTTMNNKK
jgi:hypothetical protein